jgi:SAM-dependent methyltransferase
MATQQETQEPTFGRWEQRMLSATGTSMEAVEPSILGALQARLDELLADTSRPLKLLDAGCGKHRAVPVADECHVVGIDINESQLANNPAIDEVIVGDIQTCELGLSRFDAVICWDVLEHLDHPHRALLNFISALQPGGVMILAVPHVRSIKGAVTRFTPFWVHGWVWHVLDIKPEIEPFPTVMSPSITPDRLRAFARNNDLAIEFSAEYEGWKQKKLRSRLRVTGRAFQVVRLIVRVLSLGTVTVGVTDAVIVMQKRAAADAHRSPATTAAEQQSPWRAAGEHENAEHTSP